MSTKKNLTLTALALAAGFAAVSSPGRAQAAPGRIRGFHPADQNHDGLVSRGEARRYDRRLSVALRRPRAFHPADLNLDGFVSRFEALRYDRRLGFRFPRARAFHPADLDLDGVVSRREARMYAAVPAAPASWHPKPARGVEPNRPVPRADRNRDGRLSPVELAVAAQGRERGGRSR